jgi:hypothetical protein
VKLAAVMRPIVLLAGNEHPADDARRARLIRDARIAVIRRVGWDEIPKDRLQPRSRWLVDLETDALFNHYSGTLFATGSANLIPDHVAGLVFYLDDDGEPIVLERLAWRWGEVVERQARRSQGSASR